MYYQMLDLFPCMMLSAYSFFNANFSAPSISICLHFSFFVPRVDCIFQSFSNIIDFEGLKRFNLYNVVI